MIAVSLAALLSLRAHHTGTSVLYVLALASVVCSVSQAILFCWNLLLYRAPPALPTSLSHARGEVSVLIPARDEEKSIAAAVEAALASTGVYLEVVVLDDASADRTAEIVSAIAARDKRVRLESAPPLPAGWNGKQHACAVLASLARHDLLCFIDADVRLAPEAVARMLIFRTQARSSLVSGFPRQQTVTPMEWLLLPLIHLVLLGFLPLAMMRRSLSPAFAAGCGQFMLVDRSAYEGSGTHAAIRTTMHDGIRLPALLRAHGHRTDIGDITDLADCRMYRSAKEVWQGLAKNATEGLAAPARIVPFTLFLLCGHVLPAILLIAALAAHQRHASWLAAIALCASYLPRMLSAFRFRQSTAGAILHPVGILLLVALQWYAFLRKLRGRKSVWKHRLYQAG